MSDLDISSLTQALVQTVAALVIQPQSGKLAARSEVPNG